MPDIAPNAASYAHSLITARAKHRRTVDKAVLLLQDALDLLGTDGDIPFPEVARHRVTCAIREMLASKPEAGAWTE